MNNETLNESTFANFRRELQTLNYVELNYLISDIMLEIKKRSYNEGMVKAMTSGISAEAIAPTKSDQQVRDEIIEKAKRDVADLGLRMINPKMDESEGNVAFRLFRTKVKFVVNAKKRTVVALVYDKVSNIGLCEKGIAKCDPSDCFNAHIGKAISLRRALGLEVPTEYLTAPQPTEVRIGDVVTFPKVDEWHGKVNYRVDSLYPKNDEKNLTVISDNTGGPIIERAHADFSDGLGRLVIIDDSREEVTE